MCGSAGRYDCAFVAALRLATAAHRILRSVVVLFLGSVIT